MCTLYSLYEEVLRTTLDPMHKRTTQSLFQTIGPSSVAKKRLGSSSAKITSRKSPLKEFFKKLFKES